jgi:hypothetical protein
VPELFSPQAAEVDREIMQDHWTVPVAAGDDYAAAERAYWPNCFGTPPPAREIVAGGRRRPTTPTVREDVLTLHARGLLPAAIADVLNLADRRVKDIIRKATKPA